MKLQWTTRTIEQQGLQLPYRKTVFKGGRDRTVSTGTVFISQETLEAVAERHENDYHYGLPLLDLDDAELLALEQNRLAVTQVHRGYYGTDKLRNFLKKEGN